MALYTGRGGKSTDRIDIGIINLKQINNLFYKLPQDISTDFVWATFWKEVTVPLAEEAAKLAPELGESPKVSRKIVAKGIPYPPDKSKRIAKGTLRKSIGFFRTKASKKYFGGYIGPRVKGAYRKNKGGYFGAWIEYGNEVMHFGDATSKARKFMAPAWAAKKSIVESNGLNKAEEIVIRLSKKYIKDINKFGRLGLTGRAYYHGGGTRAFY